MHRRLCALAVVLVPLAPAAAVQQITGQRMPIQNPCADTLRDASGAGCLEASSAPVLGSLYPLSTDLSIDPASGWVGLGTTAPSARLTVAGDAHVFGDLALGGVTDGIQFSSSNPWFLPDAPMMTMFTSGFSNAKRTVLAHSPTLPDYGLAYDDGVDQFVFQTSNAGALMSIDLNDKIVSITGVLNAASTVNAISAATSGVNSWGVWGTNSSAGGIVWGGAGVKGVHLGVGKGVWGEASAPGGVGVEGHGEVGVLGRATGASTWGVYSSGDFGASGTKSFVQPHPEDPGKEIHYVSLEGNEAGTYFRGTARLVDGVARIVVPEDFRLVTEEAGLTVQVTPLGDARTWLEERSLARIVVRGSADVEFDYFVNGVRRGFAGHEPVQPNRMFVPRYRDEPYARELPDAARDLMVSSGLLNADYTPNEANARRLGWTLAERPARDD